MSTQHTPGPWQHGVENEGYFIANGELRPDIAKCIRSRPDADLIAAAPELLEELIKAVALINELSGGLRYKSPAIAKATGGA